jgi:p24 family protein delta-1
MISWFLLVLLFQGSFVDCFQFQLTEASTKCFSEEISRDALALGTYKIPPGNKYDDGVVSIKATGPTLDSLGASKTHFKKKVAKYGNFAFTAEETGSHHVCFSNMGHKPVRIEFTLKVGVAAKDYSEVARKEHLEPLQVELKRLEDAAKEIHTEQLYMRRREEEMRDTNESTSDRLKWFSTSTVLILSILGGWQILYLRSFFRSKNLPGNWH